MCALKSAVPLWLLPRCCCRYRGWLLVVHLIATTDAGKTIRYRHVFSWLQDYVDHQECVTRKDLVLAVLRGWEEMPESVILNAYSHLPKVHAGIVERNGGNRCTDDT